MHSILEAHTQAKHRRKKQEPLQEGLLCFHVSLCFFRAGTLIPLCSPLLGRGEKSAPPFSVHTAED